MGHEGQGTTSPISAERDGPIARASWEEKLRETEELFRTTVENMPVNLVLYDREYRILYLNPALAALLA